MRYQWVDSKTPLSRGWLTCLSCSICSLVKKLRAKPVFTSRLPLLFGLSNLCINHSGQGDGREWANAIICVFNFDLWNAKVTEVWKNFPDIWHRHRLGRLSLPEVLHHLYSENTKNEVDWNHMAASCPQIFFPLVASVRICAHTHPQRPLGPLVQSMSKVISTFFWSP